MSVRNEVVSVLYIFVRVFFQTAILAIIRFKSGAVLFKSTAARFPGRLR